MKNRYRIYAVEGNTPVLLGRRVAHSFKEACAILFTDHPFYDPHNNTFCRASLHPSADEAIRASQGD